MNAEPCRLVRLTKAESELIQHFRLLSEEIKLLVFETVVRCTSDIPEGNNVVSLRPLSNLRG